MSLIKEESVDKNVGIISMQDFLHFLKVNSFYDKFQLEPTFKKNFKREI